MAEIAIVGLGLIGGSLALALKDAHAIRAVERDARSRDLAREAGIHLCDSLETLARGSDLVILAAPLSKLPALVAAVAPHLPQDAILTDVGGVKGPIVAAGRQHLPDGRMVGGHPMAGSVGQGFRAADAGLFRGAFWALTPGSDAERQASARIQRLLEPAGAQFVEMSPEDHDAAVAYTSHVPYLLALALARAAQSARKEGLEAVERLVGPGFRDTTRLAMTPPALGQDMATMNAAAVQKALGAIRYQLAQMEIMLGGDMARHFAGVAEGTARWRESL